MLVGSIPSRTFPALPSATILHMTNNPRIYLWAVLALMVWLNYDAWNRDYGARPEVITSTTRTATGTSTGSTAPGSADLANQVPQAEKSPATTAPAPSAAMTGDTSQGNSVPGAADAAGNPGAAAIHVRTDVLDLDISMRGGTIDRVDLLKYPKVKGEAAPVRLENQDEPLIAVRVAVGADRATAHTDSSG